MTTEPEAHPTPWVRLRRSARVRLVAASVLLVLLAVLASVLASRQLLLLRLDQRIDRELSAEVAELRTLAVDGVDPATGEPFADVRTLMRVQLERSLPGRGETMLSIVDGQVAARSAQPPPVRLDADAGLVELFASATEPVLGQAGSEQGSIRYAAVPVVVGESPEQGVFVVAVFRDIEAAEVREVTQVLAGVGAASVAVTAVLAWMLAGRILAPVRAVRSTARRIGETDLSRRIPVTGTDDVSDLARTFNEMLDRIEEAFGAQRQFADDAGHELRTPITIVRGHLELLSDDPVRRREQLDLVMDELDRMARMVSDLLVLTRSGRPDFLTLRPVDLAVLGAELHEKASALAPRRWCTDEVAEGTIVADRQRLTQAVLQLAQNAAQHTADGDEIWLGSRRTADGVRFWVRDSGPGVPPQDAQRVFERFARGSDARRSGSGAGLGLSIVRAIAEAHGGAVALLDDGRPGATVVVDIPERRT